MNSYYMLSTPIYISATASVVGEKEGNGPLHDCFDLVESDPMLEQNTWEASESTFQKKAVQLLLQKMCLLPSEISLTFAGDLLAQTIASSFGAAASDSPYYGLYSACATIGEALSIGSLILCADYPAPILCVTSSHFASAEKEFRFPLSYGSQRPFSSTWTVTGAASFLLDKKPSHQPFALHSAHGYAAITAITAGKIIDYGIKDSWNMGACMAPAAFDTIRRHLQSAPHPLSSYDKIFTGDLGKIGSQLLLKLLSDAGIDIQSHHEDCGLLIYHNKAQDTHSGGSGCACSALVLSASILPKVASGEWKRVLFVPTGALLSKVSFNEGDTIPGIAHALVIEHIPK